MADLKNHIEGIMYIFNKKLFFAREGLSSSITCEVTIDKIFMQGTKNCKINIKNLCINNAKLSEMLFLESIFEYTKTLTDYEKKEIALFFDVEKLENLKTDGKDLIAQCRVSSQLNNIINIKEIFIGKCNFVHETNFDIINTGSSNVSCIMNKIFNKLQPNFETLKKFELSSNFFYFHYLLLLVIFYFIVQTLFFKSIKMTQKNIILF